jgi:hypothetical protein
VLQKDKGEMPGNLQKQKGKSFFLPPSLPTLNTMYLITSPHFLLFLSLLLLQRINLLKHSGYYVYTICVNIPKLCILPTQCIYVFCMVLRVNSDYFLDCMNHADTACEVGTGF